MYMKGYLLIRFMFPQSTNNNHNDDDNDWEENRAYGQ